MDMRRITRWLLVVSLIAGCTERSGTEPTTAPRIVSVVDGDTIVIEVAGQEEVVRLLGIDTPETVDPNRPEQCFGAEASARLTSLLSSASDIVIERDVEARDQYGRLLAYVRADGVLINELLLREGLADLAIYEPNEAYRPRLEAAEIGARTAAAGLWGECGGPDVPLDPS